MKEVNRSEKVEMITLHKIMLVLCSVMLVYDYFNDSIPAIVRVKNPGFSLLGPYNSTQPNIKDIYQQLIDIKDFHFKSNPQPCRDYPEGLLLMIMVASNPNNSENRMIIRNTWGKSLDSTKVVFLLGESENKAVALNITNESKLHGDIVQGSFTDAYRNMTYKHVMGLKWIVHHCPSAKYVLKTDDDVLVNSHELRRFLARELSPWGARGLILCQVLERALAQRSEKSKWKVTNAEYKHIFYPTYCAGWSILYSHDVIGQLLKNAQKAPYFWIDDVHITGILANQLGIVPTPLFNLILNKYRANILIGLGHKYIGPFLFGPPDLSTNKIMRLWRAIPE